MLTAPFNIKLPLILDQKQVNASKVDVSKGTQDTDTKLYYFYDLNFEVTNHSTLMMPKTGGLSTYLPIVIAMISIIGGGIFLTRKRKTEY